MGTAPVILNAAAAISSQPSARIADLERLPAYSRAGIFARSSACTSNFLAVPGKSLREIRGHYTGFLLL